MIWRVGLALYRHKTICPVLLYGKVRGDARRLYARQRSHAFEHLTVKASGRVGVLVTLFGERHLGRQNVLRLESRVNGAQLGETLDKQPRADEQDEGGGNLRDDEGVAHPVAAEALSRTLASVLERTLYVCLERLRRRGDAENDTRYDGDQKGEAQYAQVQCDLV